MEIEVIKKDGSREPFDQDKIARVVTAAGLKPQEGFELALVVAKWAKESAKDQISTGEIRNRVVEELQKVNPTASAAFLWYEKKKDSLASGQTKPQ